MSTIIARLNMLLNILGVANSYQALMPGSVSLRQI